MLNEWNKVYVWSNYDVYGQIKRGSKLNKECRTCKYAVDIGNKDIQCSNKRSMFNKELVTADFNCEKYIKNKKGDK